MGVTSDAKFDTSSNVKELVDYISTGDYNYMVQFAEGLPLNLNFSGGDKPRF